MYIKKLFGEKIFKKNCIITPLPQNFFEIKNFKKGFLYSTGEIKNIPIVFTKMGSSFVGDTLMFLKDLDIEKFIFIGFAGAINKNFKIGEITIPEKSYFFGDYVDILTGKFRKKIFSPDFNFKNYPELKKFKKTKNLSFPSLFFEKIYLEKLKKMKIDSIEMETSVFYSITKFIKKKGISFLIISDYVKDFNFLEITKQREKLKNSLNEIIKIVEKWA